MTEVRAACRNSNLEDLNALIKIMDDFKKGGVKVPPTLENTLRVTKAHLDSTGKGIESACEDFAAWIHSNEDYCAGQVGFESYAQMSGGTVSGEASDDYYICLAGKQRRWQAKSVDSVLSAKNPKSFIAVYTSEMKQAIREILTKYLGGKAKEAVKNLGSQPSN